MSKKLQPPFKVIVDNFSKDAGVADKNGTLCWVVGDTWSAKLEAARRIAAGLRLVVKPEEKSPVKRGRKGTK